MEEKVEYEEVQECEHSYNKTCFTSLSTMFKPYQDEKCTETFVKDCFIELEKSAVNTSVVVCRKPLVRDCEGTSGELICSTQYETQCSTRQTVIQVKEDVAECEIVLEDKCLEDTSGIGTSKTLNCAEAPTKKCSLKSQPVDKIIPETECSKIGVEMCGPAGCGYYEGAEECSEEGQTVVFDKPVEVCTV